jgi:hypothetical protein
MAQWDMEQPTAVEALRNLEPLVGEWDLEARGPGGELWPGGGRCIFEWHDSRAHLIQRTTVGTPDAPDSIAIIGCDAGNNRYFQLYADERGVCRLYDMNIGDDEWTLRREGDPFTQRFIATFTDDGDTISGRWEKADPGPAFTTDFYLSYHKVTASP